MRIRELTTSDYETVYGFIINEMGHAEVSFVKMSASLDNMKDNESYLLFVAEHNDQVIGFVSAVKLFGCVDSRSIEITCLVISKEYQKRGFGKSLLKHIESLGERENIKIFSVTSGKKRIDAHNFYLHNGYEKGGFAFYKGAVILKPNTDSM